jgi:hypothetical protein
MRIDKYPSKPPAFNEAERHAPLGGEEASEQAEIDAEPEKPREARDQDHSDSLPTALDKHGAMATQFCIKTLKPASPESDVTMTNLATIERSKGTILVPASSPSMTQAVAHNGEKGQSQDEIEDVYSQDEPLHSCKESDPIEAEPTQPPINQPGPARSIEPAPRESRGRAPRVTLNPPPVSEQPSRRSGRLANRRSSVGISKVKPVPQTQIDLKAPVSVKSRTYSVKEGDEQTRDERAEANREKSGNEVKHKSTQSRSSGNDVSPSATQRVDSLRPSSQAEWTTLTPPEPTQPDDSSVIDEPRTSSQGLAGKQSPGEDESSTLEAAEKETPMPTRQRAVVASQRKKGRAQPLFFPGSSQAPRARASPSASGSVNESEKATAVTRKTPTRSTSAGTPFRRLTDISSQEILFSKSKVAQLAVKNIPNIQVQSPFAADGDGEDDEESSTSSGDTAVNSHIPKERRAGARRISKGQGLSSLAW